MRDEAVASPECFVPRVRAASIQQQIDEELARHARRMAELVAQLAAL